MGEGSVKSRLRPPRTIERPRLTRMLDASTARVMLLLAPAGFGKTTLTRQWFAPGDKIAMWHRATQASSDVAALGASIARAADEFLPGVGDRLTQVIRHTAAPARDVEDLVTAFVEELAPFPAGGWLVLDDYHFIVASAASERLVEALTEVPGLRMLIATRRRPRWATVRRSLYGEVAEVSQAELAFTEEEAADLLRHLPPAKVADFVERTTGWPAVLQLASVSGGRELPDIEMPPELHHYFAEELFQAATPALQDALVRLALLPTLRPALVELALGPDHEAICEEALTLGFLSVSADRVHEFHPLLRAFLEPRARQVPEAAAFGQHVAEFLVNTASWDEAFALVTSQQRPDLFPMLVEQAFDDLLTDGRISTLEAWISHAAQIGASFPMLDLAEAEVARRLGDMEVGEVRALQAAHSLPENDTYCSRAWAVAGECAHLAARPADAAEYHRRAEHLAATSADARRAVWGQYLAAIQLEREESVELLEKLGALNDGSAASMVRVAAGDLQLAVVRGKLADAAARNRRHLHLVDRISDPVITTGFLNRLAWAYIMSGQYTDALACAEQAVAEAHRTNAPFALAHLTPPLAMANIGLRKFRHAAILLDNLDTAVQRTKNPYEGANLHVLRARLELAERAQGAAALEISLDDLAPANSAALVLEALSLKALALAVEGAAEQAIATATAALPTSAEVQGHVITAFARVIHAHVNDDPAWHELLVTASQLLDATQNYDSFVYAYRAYPDLLQLVLQADLMSRHRLDAILRAAVDFRIAATVGITVEPPRSPRQSLLTPREYEVYILLCKGLSNREIADTLVISQSTAKVHVRHICEKLGVRTRLQAVRAAQETL